MTKHKVKVEKVFPLRDGRTNEQEEMIIEIVDPSACPICKSLNTTTKVGDEEGAWWWICYDCRAEEDKTGMSYYFEPESQQIEAYEVKREGGMKLSTKMLWRMSYEEYEKMKKGKN